MARRHWPWDVLGIDRTGDKAAIRSAYAARLKAMDVDQDIQGFSALRSARDAALREAACVGQEEADAEAEDPLFDAGPDLIEEIFPASSDSVADPPGVYLTPDGPENMFSADGDDDFAWDNENGYGTGAYADPDSRIEHGEGQKPEDAPDVQLSRLLYPNGGYSDEAFTYEGYAAAEVCLHALVADAKAGDLGREQAVDHWLSEILAETWPRSAPLLGQAAEAFDWLAESGEIGERPSLQFLNPRLRGMRFVTKVEQPGHPLYKAWAELKRPGKRGFLDRFRVRREEVETLLGGIRTRYPEVESHLEAERVASWEKPAPSWIVWVIQRVFIFIVVIQALALCGRALDDDKLPPEQVDRVVAEVFGPGRTMAEVQALDSKLADLVYETIKRSNGDGLDNLARIEQGVVVRMRGLAAFALNDAPKEDLLAILAVRRDLLEVAREGGTSACAAYMSTAILPDTLIVREDIRERERALMWRLAQAGRLDSNWTTSEARSLPLPPWVGPGVADRTGLPPDRINAVLGGEETQDLCAVRIALIDTLLSRPNDAPIELLRFM
ncbi:MAG: hypothetical protein ACK4GD_07245 [Sphingomonadaceae bacterium]